MGFCISRLPIWARELVQHGHRPDTRYAEPCQAVAATCRAMVNVGATDEDIVQVFWAHPRGIGAYLRAHGELALHRIIVYTRQGTDADVLVRIHSAAAEGEHRTLLKVEVLDGAHAGQRFTQDLWHHRSVWRWLFEHAGLTAPALPSTEAAQALLGRTVGARLEEPAPGDLRVAHWLAPGAVESIREHHVEQPAPGTWTPPPGPERPWDGALRAMAARGLRVDPVAWAAAVAELRARYAAQAARGDPQAQGRLLQLNGYADGVLQAALADPEHRVRAAWHMGSWSTRVTSTRPNLQGITKDGGLRAALVPAPGHLLVVADWKHSQYRIAAGVSGDEALTEALAPGRDLYAIIGGMAGMPPDLLRTVGKNLALPLFNCAGAKRLTAPPPHHHPGAILTIEAAQALRVCFADAFPKLVAYRASCAGLERFTSPLGYEVEIPEGSRNEPGVMAGIIQAREADALRWAVLHADVVMAGTGAQVVLVNQDEVVWEVPAEHAQEAAQRAEGWMLACQAWVCAPCPPAVKVDVRPCWARGATP